MRIGAAMALLAALALSGAACSRSELFRQYQYEEDVYLSLDGSATVYVNSSVAALDALRGASFDTSSNAAIDRDAVRAWFTTPVTHVTRRPTLSRRSGRRFVHVRLDADDVQAPVAGGAARLVDVLVRQGWRCCSPIGRSSGAPVGKSVGEARVDRR